MEKIHSQVHGYNGTFSLTAVIDVACHSHEGAAPGDEGLFAVGNEGGQVGLLEVGILPYKCECGE